MALSGPSKEDKESEERDGGEEHKLFDPNEEQLEDEVADVSHTDVNIFTMQFKVYRRMEFSSDRKRMSVLLRDPRDGTVKLFTKGADSVIEERLDLEQSDQEVIDCAKDFIARSSSQGFRVLLMGMRVLSQSELSEFEAEVKAAEVDVENREALLMEAYDRLERGFVLLGATAVEDRLQDEVPETIADLQEAGIRIWMLTGDKLETAENIGYSCHLLTPDMVVWHVRDE